MSAIELCDWSDLPRDQCACHHCRPEVPERRPNGVDYTFTARFESEADCGHRVTSGDTIARDLDGDLICQRCTQEATA